MNDIKPIGGYFELELSNRGGFLHDDGVLLNSGRNALEYILRSLPDIKHLYIPYFTCDVVMEPIDKMAIPYSRYHINERLEIAEDVNVQEGEYILYTNYYGVKDCYCKALAERYGDKLIIDNAQAFYAKRIDGIKTFYSPRKYVGIPDGGIAYIEDGISVDQYEQDQSWDRCSHLLKRYDLIPSEGYADFKANSHKLANQPIKRMSNLTQSLLCSIDFDEIKEARRKNFTDLHKAFKSINKLDAINLDDFEVPLVYPLWVENGKELKAELIKQQIFCATYWPNVFDWCKEEDLEYNIADNTICIPVDQRYDNTDVKRIKKVII